MANILEFRSTALRDTGPALRPAPQASAEIVLFPGVRYERWDEDRTPKPGRVKKSRRHDRLELDD